MKNAYKQGERDALAGKPRFIPRWELNKIRYDRGYDAGLARNKERTINGIAAYKHEQEVFVRLLRAKGKFTEVEFDKWFRGREWRRPIPFTSITGDAFILGMGINGGNRWAEMLELLQIMIALEIIDTITESGLIVYSLKLTPDIGKEK